MFVSPTVNFGEKESLHLQNFVLIGHPNLPMLTLPLGLYPEGKLIVGYIAGLFMRFNDPCKRVKLLVPGVGWWVKLFDVEP